MIEPHHKTGRRVRRTGRLEAKRECAATVAELTDAYGDLEAESADGSFAPIRTTLPFK